MYKIRRLKDVMSDTGLAKSTIYKMIAKGIFPKPIMLSSKAVGWLESDIQAWLADRIAKTISSRESEVA